MLYDRLIDRDAVTNGTAYMMLHVFLILSLNHITAALEFMRQQHVKDLPKNIFLISSFVLYFIMMFLIMRFNRAEYRRTGKGTRLFFAGMGVFVLLMIVSYKTPAVSIGVTVVYIWAVFVSLWKMSKQHEKENP